MLPNFVHGWRLRQSGNMSNLFIKDIQHVCAAASRFSSYLNVGRPSLRSDSHVIMFCHWVVLFKLPHFLGHNVMNNGICQTK